MASVDEAQAAVAAAEAALAQAKQDAEDAAEAAKKPRPVGSILIDIVRHLVSRAGNHPDLEKLEKELNAAIGKDTEVAPAAEAQ